MKRISLLLIFSFLAVTSFAQSFSGSNDSTFTYSFDIRQSDNGSNTLGLDFDVRYDLIQLTPSKSDNPEGNKLNFSLSLNGYQDFNDKVTEFNQMNLEANILGRNYSTQNIQLSPSQQLYYLGLLEKTGANIGLTPSEQNDLTRFINSTLKGRKFFSYKAGYKFQSDQSISFYQHILQAGVSFEIPKLHEALEVFFAETRTSSLQDYKTQPIRVYTGLDYIVGSGGVDEASVDSSNVVPRFRLEAAWSTLVFDNFELRTTFESNYFFDEANIEGVATNELINFFNASLLLPISTDKTSILLSYSKGKIPPLYTETAAGSIGISVSLD